MLSKAQSQLANSMSSVVVSKLVETHNCGRVTLENRAVTVKVIKTVFTLQLAKVFTTDHAFRETVRNRQLFINPGFLWFSLHTKIKAIE